MSTLQIDNEKDNPLGSEKISSLLFKFAVPSIIAMLVNSLYNIVDQIFIGQGVGVLGNAATNIAFPLTTICTAVALLLGIGGAASFSLELGRENKDKARKTVGTSITCMFVFGLIIAVIVSLFLDNVVVFFGATEQILPYSKEYMGIISFGLPFLIFATGYSAIIRADGAPVYAMVSTAVGAVLNIILDPIFIFIFDMGVGGAALATVISQIVSALICLIYVRKMRNVTITKSDIRINFSYLKKISALGTANFINQISITVVQIVLNNSLAYYGAQSAYGGEIPIAVAGIVIKIYMIFMAVVIGIAQGMQPIAGFNYGAKKYSRVKEVYKLALKCATATAVISFILFELFPKEIIDIFGNGSPEYFEFAIRFFRVFMIVNFVNGVQPVTSNLFVSIGKAGKGMFVSLARQILFMLPLIVILPKFMGLDGIIYAAPVADIMSFVVAMILIRGEIKAFPKEESAMAA